MDDIELKLKDADKKTDDLLSGQVNKFTVKSSSEVTVIEMEDLNFHFDSAVLLPDYGPSAPQPGTNEQNRITGLGVLFACFKQTEKKDFQQTILIAGHTDKKGSASYNLNLSQKRAENVFFIFMGKRSNWVESSNDKNQVEDVQQILKWISFNFQFECDPGSITNSMNQDTENAILNFQKRYNIDFVNLKIHQSKFSRAFTKIDEDGKVGKQTWGAFFDMYTLELLIVMGINEDGLNEERAKLQFVKKQPPNPAPVIGCGENHPASEAKTEDENPVDRRVEILFFDEGEEPELKCHPAKFQCIKSKCDLYPKGFFNRNPVPADPLPLPSGIAVRVHLKFIYKTPEGAERTFPKGFPFTLKFGDNSEELHSLDSDDGTIFLQVLREKKTFTIEFKFSEINYIAQPSDDSKKDELVPESKIKDKIKSGFKVFSLPLQWNLKNSTWELSPSVPDFDTTEKQFKDLDNLSVENIGSEASPIKTILDPHWQFLKFSYFDRFLKTKLNLPSITLEGFHNSASTSVVNIRSNWQTKDEESQCIPWILRDIKRPDKNVLIQFRSLVDTFIESSGTSSSPSRKYVTKNLAATSDPGLNEGSSIDRDFKKAEAARLTFYDIPKLWKSKNYFAKLSGGKGNPPSKVGKFEDLVSEITSNDKPLIFSLDDIILTDKDLNPIKWVPDNKPENRVSIFCNTFSHSGPNSNDLSSEGLFKPDGKAFIDSTNTPKTFTSNNLGFFTQLPADEKTRNYISDYPDWTRLVITQGNFFEAFDKRTVEGKGDVVGARAAASLIDVFSSSTTFVPPRKERPRVPPPVPPPGKGEFAEVQALFEQDHVTISQIGRYDMIRLRCCDIDTDGATELSACIVYLRQFFNFNSNIPTSLNPNAKPLNLTGNAAKDWVETAILNLLRRWNGPDITTSPATTFNPGAAFILPLNPAEKKFKSKIIWFSQDLPKEKSHFEIAIYDDKTKPGPGGVRGFMRSSVGEGVLGQTDNTPLFKVTMPDKTTRFFGGFFTFAHEVGHGGSLMDEYIELTASGGVCGFDSNSPGSPFKIDDQAIMRANRQVRARHYWHIAEWFRQLDEKKIEYKINHGTHDYFIPHHSNEPHKNFIGHPLVEKNDQEFGDHGKFNIFFYPLGKEEYSNKVLPGIVGKLGAGDFDGIIIVLIKMEFDFPIKDSTKIDNFLKGIDSRIFARFHTNLKIGVNGNVGGKKFNRIFLHFSPRYFAKNYSTTVRNDTNEHIIIKVKNTGKGEWDSGLFSSKHKLFYPLDSLDTFTDFFGNMMGLADGTLGNAASYEPIAKKVIPDAKVFSL
ncbi:MAG: OmpA family protein [Ignavibacteriaceae bacterium]